MFLFDSLNVWKRKNQLNSLNNLEKQCLELNDHNLWTPPISGFEPELRCFASSESGTFFLSHLQSPGSIPNRFGFTKTESWRILDVEGFTRFFFNISVALTLQISTLILAWKSGQTTHHEILMDGGNPANQLRGISHLHGFYTSQVVVWDFFHQQY